MKPPKPLYRKPPSTATGPRRLLMAEQWDQFACAVLQPDTPADQKREMRRAFYAGAQAILFRVIELFAPETEPTPEDLAIMDGIHEELQEFAKSIGEGRA